VGGRPDGKDQNVDLSSAAAALSCATHPGIPLGLTAKCLHSPGRNAKKLAMIRLVSTARITAIRRRRLG
jgi:hypothetical protein